MTRRDGKRRRAPDRDVDQKPRFDIAGSVDVVRQILARADAMVSAAEVQLEQFTWDDHDEAIGDDRRLEHLSHLLGAAKESVRGAVYASGTLAAELAKHPRDA